MVGDRSGQKGMSYRNGSVEACCIVFTLREPKCICSAEYANIIGV